MRRSKYGAKKVTVNGILFDSKKEARRYIDLKRLEDEGVISSLRLQVEYVLIPEHRATSNEIYKSGPKKGCFKPGKILERKCSYFADFEYIGADGRLHVEDTKGMRTPEYIIKRKLMLHEYGIVIEEV